MKKSFDFTAAVLAAVLAVAMGATLPAFADEDFAFVYRGRITAQSGVMPEELQVRYALYRGENDATPVWSQTKMEHPSTNGVFQSVLSGNGLQTAFADKKARFLGVTLGTNGTERTPRQEIIAAPLAEFSDTAADAPADPVFVNAAVGRMQGMSMGISSLSVTNRLSLPSTAKFSLQRVAPDANGAAHPRIVIQKPQKGHVSLFASAPLRHVISEAGDIPEGTELPFPTGHGGFVVAISVNGWQFPTSAPCITWPTPGGIPVYTPLAIRGPAVFYFYEFGGN